MKIRTKIAMGARFVTTLVVVASSLLSGYGVALSQHADALIPDPGGGTAASANAQIVNNSTEKCTAYIQGPTAAGDGHILSPVNSLVDPSNLESEAKNTLNDVQDNKNMLEIRFKGVNNNTPNNTHCDASAELYRRVSATGSTATTFYGWWSDQISAHVLIEGTVDLTNQSISFFIPDSATGNQVSGGFNMKLTDSKSLLKNKTYFPATGGGGSTSAGTNCFEKADTNAALEKCIAMPQYGHATFIDAAHIRYAGDVYTADIWGNNTMVYKLTKPADDNRIKGGTPEIHMNTKNEVFDINLDNGGASGDFASQVASINSAINADTTGTLTLENVDTGGNSSQADITADTGGMRHFATYYSTDDVVTLDFTSAGNNEKPFYGTYARVAGSNKFTLAGSNWGGNCSNLATFTFTTDPKTIKPAYQGSTLVTQPLPATWGLNANANSNTGSCDVTDIHPLVDINTTDSAPDPNAAGKTDTTGDSPTIDCSVKLFNPLSWIFCPLTVAFETIVTSLDNEINNFLDIKPGKGSYPSSASCGNDQWCSYYQSWIVVRNISLGLIAVFALVAVVSQAFGLELLDAYTIRKVLPRLLVAAIGVTLSWPLMMFFINLTNDLGIGIRQLIYAPFTGGSHPLNAQLGGGAQFIATFFVATGAIALLGFAGLLSFVATAALAVSIAFLVLIIRQMVISLLVILAPIALACYVLPGTQKVWKLWWDSFSRGLLMFPIIAAFIAIGRVFAAVNSHGQGSINQIISFVAYFAPYFMIPFTFRLAGGAISTLGGLVNDRSRGAFDRLSKFRKGQTEKRVEHYGDKYGARTLQAKASAVRGLNSYASRSGRVGGIAARFASRRIEGIDNTEAQMSALNARRSKQLGDQIATGDDSEIRGLTVNRKAARAAGELNASNGWSNELMRRAGGKEDGALEYKTLGGGWVSESAVLNGQRRWGHDVAAQQAATSYEMRKAMEEPDVAGISQRYASLAKDQWGMTDTQAQGSWIGAGFENQNQHLEFKNTNWRNGELNAEKFSKEVYEKKGTYPLSQMSSHTITQLKHAYDIGDTATKQRIQAVAESFVQRGGSTGGQVGEAEGGVPITAPGQAPDQQRNRDYVQTNSQGSAHVAQQVRDLAAHVGVYTPNGPGPTPLNRPEPINIPPQR